MDDNPLLREWGRAMLPEIEHAEERFGTSFVWFRGPPPQEGLAAIAAAKEEPRLMPKDVGLPNGDLGDLSFVISFSRRLVLAKMYAWAIPTSEAIEAIVRHSPRGVVEIGAGTGYWASFIRAQGTEVAAYDSIPYSNIQAEGTWSEVKRGGPKAVRFHPEKTLFLCWPPYATPMAHIALSTYAGDTLIYVGEGGGGATGDDAFHHLLELTWEVVDEVSLPQWPGIRDHLFIYKRLAERSK